MRELAKAINALASAIVLYTSHAYPEIQITTRSEADFGHASYEKDDAKKQLEEHFATLSPRRAKRQN